MRHVIGSRSFRSKRHAISNVQTILRTATIDEPLRGEPLILIRALFGHHPEAASKSQHGVAGFMVRLNDFYGVLSRGFHVIADNGQTTAWSYRNAFSPDAEPTPFAAMRAATLLSQRRIVMTYYGSLPIRPCQTCGRLLQRNQAVVHHEPPNRFRDIAAAFIAEHGSPVVVPADGLGDVFADLALHHAWVAFHEERARRSVVCAGCNYAAERADAPAPAPASVEPIAAVTLPQS